jgi:hypothetical protein
MSEKQIINRPTPDTATSGLNRNDRSAADIPLSPEEKLEVLAGFRNRYVELRQRSYKAGGNLFEYLAPFYSFEEIRHWVEFPQFNTWETLCDLTCGDEGDFNSNPYSYDEYHFVLGFFRAAHQWVDHISGMCHRHQITQQSCQLCKIEFCQHGRLRSECSRCNGNSIPTQSNKTQVDATADPPAKNPNKLITVSDTIFEFSTSWGFVPSAEFVQEWPTSSSMSLSVSDAHNLAEALQNSLDRGAHGADRFRDVIPILRTGRVRFQEGRDERGLPDGLIHISPICGE